ncbi:MAG: hypothetical protein RR837_02760, partial [Bacteroidales bacterium]
FSPTQSNLSAYYSIDNSSRATRMPLVSDRSVLREQPDCCSVNDFWVARGRCSGCSRTTHRLFTNYH